jgi:hypothetical protein
MLAFEEKFSFKKRRPGKLKIEADTWSKLTRFFCSVL